MSENKLKDNALSVAELAAEIRRVDPQRRIGPDELALRLVRFLDGRPFDMTPVDTRHVYRVSKPFPWFCAICGYGEFEASMHLPACTEIS